MKIHNTSKGIISEINMIPLIDVMLIILIIFMIITPFFINSHIQVNLPKTSSAPQTVSSNTDKIIKITIKRIKITLAKLGMGNHYRFLLKNTIIHKNYEQMCIFCIVKTKKNKIKMFLFLKSFLISYIMSL